MAWRDESATGKEITVTQKDIREIQLAKAAIYSGCSILMKRKSSRMKTLTYYILQRLWELHDPENAKVIGLIPNIAKEKIKFVGNTAVAGVKMALVSKEVRRVAESLAKIIRYHKLAADADFASEFINAIFLPNRIIERFPSVMKLLQSFARGAIF